MKNLTVIKSILNKHNITEAAVIKAENLLFPKSYLLKDIKKFKSCIIFLIPYKSESNNPDNISKYCAVYDYHFYFKKLYETLSVELMEKYPNEEFIGFTDHSPINERDAAIKAGLGIIGKNSMLINDKYGSYVFIGSIFSTLETDALPQSAKLCINCGKCINACPTGAIVDGFDNCLSHITQKKSKSNDEIELIKSNKYVWGCDICQDVCPYNITAENSPIVFFENNIINHLSSRIIMEMDEEEFQKRAFSWRGKKTILENLSYFNE